MTNNEKIRKIADTYGYDHQSRLLIEEMAELTQAINKFWRKALKSGYEKFEELSDCLDGNQYAMQISEEIADVEICLEQVKYLLSNQEAVDCYKEQKLDREIERIEKNG